MKKTIITIIGLFGLLCIASNDVFAAGYKYHNYVYEGDKIENIYFKNKDDTLKEAHVYKINNSDKIIYSIEYDNDTKGASTDDYDDYYDYRKTNLTKAQASLANLIGYYGYNYKDENCDHTDIKWYAITQYLIWQVETDNNLKEIVNQNGEPIFNDEIAEINNLITEHYIKPDFGSQSIKAKSFDEITIEDKNGVLDEYDTLEHFGLDYQVEGNFIKATSNQNKSHIIYMTKKDKRFSRSCIFYVSENYRNAIEIGSYEEISSSVKLSFISGKVTINKLGSQLVDFKDNKFIYEYRQAEGVIYHLYAADDIYNNVGKLLYRKDELVSELVIGQDEAFDNLYLSEYYVKEVYTPYAYHVTGDPYKVNLSFDVVEQKITYKTPYQPVVVRFGTMKQTVDFINGINYALTPLANVEFALYTGEDIYSDIDLTTPIVLKDTLIDVQKSDESGTVNFKTNIPEGKYYIVNLDNNDYYHAKEDYMSFTFSVDQSVDRQYFNLNNYYALLNTQKITFKGTGSLQIYDENKNLIIESDIEEDKSVDLPFGNYYYQFAGRDYISLEVYDLKEKTIILKKEDDKKEEILDSTDFNESEENKIPNEEEKDENHLKEENKEEESNENASDEEAGKNDSNGENDYIKNPPIMVLPNQNTRPNHENINEDISMGVFPKPDESSDKEDNKEIGDITLEEPKDDLGEIKNPSDENNSSTIDIEDKEENYNPIEDIESTPDDIEKNPCLNEEDNDNLESSNDTIDGNEIDIPNDSNDEPENSSEIKDNQENSDNSIDESDNSSIPKDENTPIDDDEDINKSEYDDKNDNTIDEDFTMELPKEDDVVSTIPSNPNIEDNDVILEEIDDSSNILDNSTPSNEIDNIKEDDLAFLEKENNEENTELINNTITGNYEQIDVRVPSTDKEDYSLIIYMFILLMSSLSLIHVKN